MLSTTTSTTLTIQNLSSICLFSCSFLLSSFFCFCFLEYCKIYYLTKLHFTNFYRYKKPLIVFGYVVCSIKINFHTQELPRS
uniref:Putative ovule protein n=1 Tax=Solanum chacoense TaxID=4108 RepID=A0A0V0HTE4_SOLCH